VRVVVDARLLGTRDVGSGVYTRLVLQGLSRLAGDHEWALICRARPEARLSLDSRFVWHELPEAALLDERWEQLVLPEVVAGLGPDAYYAPTGVLPAVKTCPQVVTIHDVGVVDEPGFYPSALWRYLSKWIAAAARQADSVITVSERSKTGICRAYGLAESKVRVTPLAADDIFEPATDREQWRQVLGGYGVNGPYLLSVGALEPNKNLKAVVEAYQLAGGAARLGQPLVLVGGAGGAAAELDRLVARMGIRGDVVFTGYVPREHLPALYAGATCFVWASLYEGFGLPPLEAMACGVPVISSDRTAMPEVLGDAALLVDPTRPQAIADALAAVVSNTDARERLRQAGLRRAAGFSWQRTAAQTLQCLADAVEGGHE
jgi:glycosyltransferase involved in cell wall biosynthesis